MDKFIIPTFLYEYVEEQPWLHTATTWPKILDDLDVLLTESLFLAAIWLTIEEEECQYQVNFRHVHIVSHICLKYMYFSNSCDTRGLKTGHAQTLLSLLYFVLVFQLWTEF